MASESIEYPRDMPPRASVALIPPPTAIDITVRDSAPRERSAA